MNGTPPTHTRQQQFYTDTLSKVLDAKGEFKLSINHTYFPQYFKAIHRLWLTEAIEIELKTHAIVAYVPED